MTFSYTIGPSDYKRAIWVHMRPRRTLGCLGVLLLVLAVSSLCITTYRFITMGQDLRVALALAVCLGSLFSYFFVLMPWQLNRLSKQQKLLHEGIIVEISDVNISWKSVYGQTTLPWEVFHKWKGDKLIILVYLSDVQFHVFPRRLFPSPEDFETFQTLLRNKLGPEKP
jgi:hypothetical protein